MTYSSAAKRRDDHEAGPWKGRRAEKRSVDPHEEDTALIHALPLLPLNILMLEDNELDACMVEEELRRGHVQFTAKRVSTSWDFVRELQAGDYDLILADYRLPEVTGMQALVMAQETCPHVPFILVSGQISEEMALDTVNGGATDYVFKDHLLRLVPSVHRALREVRERNVRRRAQEALRHSEQRYRLLVEHSHDAILQLDREGRVVFANPATETVLGYQPSEFMDDPDLIGQIIQPSYRQDYGDVRDEFRRDGVITELTAEWGWTRKDGTLVHADCTVTNLVDEDDEAIGYQVIIRDMTKQVQVKEQLRQSQEELQQLNESLERRAQERASELDTACQELETFGHLVIHDPRSPVRTVRDLTQTLLSGQGDTVAPDLRKHLNQLDAHVAEVEHLFGDLLAFAVVTRHRMRMESINVGELAQVALGDLTAAQGGSPVELAVEPAPVAAGDPMMLREAIRRLLANALESTRGRTPARITVGGWMDESDTETVHYVKDNGMGFDPAHAGELYEVFGRHHDKEGIGGAGVGLAIVRRVVERHGGRVWAEGTPGEGATFYFSLPVCEE
ncbi:MAG: PAS domain S-box protein [Candidatus Brocadiae bacterium]|nr:PAS domain S-box protein [Candidatus Brocadiia bacterium]